MADLYKIDTTKTTEELRESGLYPIVDLSIFETVADIEIDDWNIEHEQEVITKYSEYLKNILSMKKSEQENYLQAIKIKEIMDTQLLEQEDSYLLALYMQTHRKSAMDYLIKNQKSPLEYLTRDEIIKAHKKLLQGTSSGKKYEGKNYRTDNEAFVAKKKDGDLYIRYFPIDYKEIEKSLMKLTLYYNSQLHSDYTLMKPILIHGLVGALQMFDDGNTRFGRMIQNIKIYELTDQNMGYNLSNPALYSSKSYLYYRDQYREKLSDVAANPNNETWNNWLNFNLNRMEDQIYYMNSKLDEYKIL